MKRNACGISLSVNLGEEKPVFLGMDTLLTMRPELTVDGVTLSNKDIQTLLAQTDGLAFPKGKWIEVVMHVYSSFLLKWMGIMENGRC